MKKTGAYNNENVYSLLMISRDIQELRPFYLDPKFKPFSEWKDD